MYNFYNWVLFGNRIGRNVTFSYVTSEIVKVVETNYIQRI